MLLYRHIDVALLRAAAWSLEDLCDRWPQLDDTEDCRAWLQEMWARPRLVDAVRQASTGLAGRVDAICAGRATEDRQVRRAAAAIVRYVLRATGRPTPFGLFAGVAPVVLDRSGRVRWGEDHRPVARVDTEWLADIVERLEACPELLERLDVVFSNLAVQRGARLVLPQGPNRVTVSHSRAVAQARSAAARPIRFGALANQLSETFAADRSVVDAMLTELVRQGFLITSLRAPLTVTDPLAHVVDRLQGVSADALPTTASLLEDLCAVQADLRRHNDDACRDAERSRARSDLSRRMLALSGRGRTPLAVDLRLDCDVHLPPSVAEEMAGAAEVLLRLTRQPAGNPAWLTYHAAFCDRYGTGTLVPLMDVIDADAGLGYPAGYRTSVLPGPVDVPSRRDERLLALAWQAAADHGIEIALPHNDIDALTEDDRFDDRRTMTHVELAGRIHAESVHALRQGDYTIVVLPARAGGTLTSRFTPITDGSGLEDAYRSLPASTEGAVTAQLSFAPAYPHAENVCRVPAYLPHLLPLGEHREPTDRATLLLDDLAIIATRDSLHLVTFSDRRIVEPQVFHALALDKQPPLLARFLAQLPRAFNAGWHAFDWGPLADALPFLPRVRHGRAILAVARWKLTARDLPSSNAGQDEWGQALERWRVRWRCPEDVDLREDDRTLRLTLGEPAHRALVRAHLDRHGHATLTEASTSADFGWLGGHAHEIAVPLVTTGRPVPTPLRGPLPRVHNHTHGHAPGCPQASWLTAKLHVHPERQDEILAEHLPALMARLDGGPKCWFVRYRSPTETDHLRLRLPTSHRGHGATVDVAGAWARALRAAGIAGRLVFDTYYPEVGRYGHGPAMHAAEAVFAADSHAVCAGLRHIPATVVHPAVLVATSMAHVAIAFLGGVVEAMQWLAARSAPPPAAVDRALADEAARLIIGTAAQDGLPDLWTGDVHRMWEARAAALASYGERTPPDADLDGITGSLLHMHHNRSIGTDPDSEATCLHLARGAARSWLARQDSER